MYQMWFERGRIFQIISILLIFLVHFNESCSSGRHYGENGARELGGKIKEASQNIQAAMTTSTRELTNSINYAVQRLSGIAESVSYELGQSIRQASSDLVTISGKLTDSVDNGVQEMSDVLRESIRAAHSIADRLVDSADEAVIQVSQQIQNAVKAVKEIANDLIRSLDKGIEELGVTFRYLADKIAEAAKQINVHIDSNHLIGMANATRDALVESVQELTTNWQVAVNTADFQDVGKGAAMELSKALQNLRGEFLFHGEIGDNLRSAVLYVSVAGGIAFSVLFVAIIVALKSCRSCAFNICTAIAEKCKCCSSRESGDDNDGRNNDCENGNNCGDDDTKTSRMARMGFSKANSLSYAGYNNFSELKNQWEKKALNDVKVNETVYWPITSL